MQVTPEKQVMSQPTLGSLWIDEAQKIYYLHETVHDRKTAYQLTRLVDGKCIAIDEVITNVVYRLDFRIRLYPYKVTIENET